MSTSPPVPFVVPICAKRQKYKTKKNKKKQKKRKTKQQNNKTKCKNATQNEKNPHERRKNQRVFPRTRGVRTLETSLIPRAVVDMLEICLGRWETPNRQRVCNRTSQK
jgi:hypothetical protein